MTEAGTDEMAAMLSITPRQVQKLQAAGVFTKAASGKWPVAATIAAYVEHRIKAEKARAERGAGDLRSQQLRSDDLELKIETRSRRLVGEARAEALAVVDEMAGALRVDLQAVPARVTTDIVMRRKIEEGIDGAFAAAADRAAAAAGRAGKARDAVAPGRADHARRVGTAKPDVPAKRRSTRAA